MSEAKVLSDRLESVLRDLNLSALESYREAERPLPTSDFSAREIAMLNLLGPILMRRILPCCMLGARN